MSEHSTDLVVLGGGSGGYAAAIRAAELGLAVTLVEADKLGGTCLHRGCIPTKALLHAAELADGARDGAQFGVRAQFDGIDIAGLHGYLDSTVSRLHQGLSGLLAGHGIEVVTGRGRLVGPRSVEVGDRTLTGEHLVLATGSYPKRLPGLPVADNIISSEQALTLDYVPDDVIVLGGGVIGVEFASIWASFGAKVTIVEALDRLLPGEDEFCSKQLSRALRRRKITAKTGARVATAESDDDAVTLTLESGEVLQAEVLLVAVGRGPATDGIGLAEAGVALTGGYVDTDDRLRTSLPGVYAVGDIVAGLQLAHRGFAHGIFVAEQIAGLDPVPVDDAGIPRVTYSHPEVASVGLTETAARARFGDAVHVVSYDLAGNGRSQILRTAGAVKTIAGPDGTVLGVHLVGDRVGELIGEAQVLVNAGVAVDAAARLIHAHPTQGEALGESLLVLAGKPLHVHS